MNALLIGVLVVGVAIAIGMKLFSSREDGETSGGRADSGGTFKAYTRPYFFSLAENKFFTAMTSATQGMDLMVFPKVGLNGV